MKSMQSMLASLSSVGKDGQSANEKGRVVGSESGVGVSTAGGDEEKAKSNPSLLFVVIRYDLKKK